MQPPRQGSRKATVYASFIKDGAESAIAIGVSAGLKLGTVKSWINAWSKATTHDVPKDKEPVQDETKKPIKGANVKVKWSDRPAKLLAKGEQVSEIKWLDTGTIQSIPNDDLTFAKPDK